VTGAIVEGPTTIEYETCAVSKAHKIISRRTPTDKATRPFFRIHVDLIQGIEAYNGHKYAIHFLNDLVRINKVKTFAQKSSTTQVIIKYCNVVERRYGFKVVVIYIDNELSLRGKFDNWTAEKGITVEYSAPSTPEQNGPAERSRGVIIMKARCMRIEAQLLEELWPKAFKAAAYITNRTPSRRLDWKTPFEKL